MNKEIELAWAAGFYDGEGSSKKIYSHYTTKTGKKRNPTFNVMMSVSQCHLEPLERFKSAVNNLGRINGPYQYKSNRRPYWVWSTSCSSAKEVYNLLEPYLCSKKKEQFIQVMNEQIESIKNRKKGWIYDEKKS